MTIFFAWGHAVRFFGGVFKCNQQWMELLQRILVEPDDSDGWGSFYNPSAATHLTEAASKSTEQEDF